MIGLYTMILKSGVQPIPVKSNRIKLSFSSGINSFAFMTKLRKYLYGLCFIPVVLLWSCASLQVEGLGYSSKSENFLASLKSFPKTSQGEAERDSVLKVFRFAEIMDKPLFQKLDTLNAFTDGAKIDSLLQAFKKQKDLDTRPDTPDRNEWWEEMWERRAGHCDTYCRMSFGYDFWDLRSRPVLLNGIPDKETFVEQECWRDKPDRGEPEINCGVWYIHWDNKNFTLVLQDDDGDGHPDRYIPCRYMQDIAESYECAGVGERDRPKSDQLLKMSKEIAPHITTGKADYRPFDGIEKILKAGIHISSFPEPGYNSIWLSAGVPLDQLKSDSSQVVCFHVSTVIYDQSRSSSALVNDSGVVICASSENLSWFPAYANYNLPDGKYKLIFNIRNMEGSRLGVYSSEFQLPTFLGISDILLSQIPSRNDVSDSLGWIKRQGNIKILDNPFSIFPPGDTIYPYLEYHTGHFTKDGTGKHAYTVSWNLYPVEEQKKKPKVTTGPLYVVKSDSTLPFIQGDNLKKKGYLIYSSSEANSLPLGIFTDPILLPEKIPQGDYFLVASIEDVNAKDVKSTSILAWRRIAIRK
jgi:hypothetical protein